MTASSEKSQLTEKSQLKTHPASNILVFLYKVLKGERRRSVARLVFKFIFKLEGGQYRSFTARKLMKRDYSVDIGAHSYGELFVPGAFAPSVEIGKYTSIAHDVRVFTQNHPVDELSTHPYFYEKKFGYIPADALTGAKTTIGHDVWIGQSAVILPGCKNIGTGAIIGAGSVVTKNVPAYAIAAGNPAKVIKYRFDETTIEKLLSSNWWDLPPEEALQHSKQFSKSQ